MHNLLQLAKRPDATDEEWKNTLKTFNAENNQNFTFVDRFGSDTKQQFLEALINKLKSNTLSDEALTEAFTALRLCFRETAALEPLMNNESILLLMDYSNLNEEKKTKSTSVLVEASKCLVNIVMRMTPNAEKFIVEQDGLNKILTALKSPDSPKEIRFPFGRLIFILSVDNNISDKLIELGIYDILIKILDESLENIDAENISYGSEALKCIFKLSMPLGPLNESSPVKGKGRDPDQEEINHFTRIVPLLQKILNLPITEKQYIPLKNACVNCLINVPTVCTTLFEISESTLGSLIDILNYQVQDTSNAAQALVPILLVLTSIARAIPKARDILREKVFPNAAQALENPPVGIEAPAPNTDTNTLAGKLIPHMTTFNMALKYYVNDFLFVLCDEDPNELVKMTGLGNAAGLLADYNLFSALGSGKKATEVKFPSPRLPSREELEEEIRQATKPRGQNTGDGQPKGFLDTLDDEEKAQQLSELLERLEAKGVVKIIRKEDTEQK